jgi:hypothetical protein
VSEKGFAEGWHNGIDFECLIGTENLSEKAYLSGQPKQLFEPLKKNELFCCPANPFLDA